MLVDGGIDRDDAWEVLDAGVREHAGGWSQVRVCVVTHMHTDHIGLVTRVRAATGAPLAMGQLDAERWTHAAAHPDEEAEYRAGLYREAGVARAIVEAVERGRRATPIHLPPVEYPLPGELGSIPDAPEWQWLWTPGHTAGHVSLLRKRDGVLIAGDAVLPHITPTIGVNRQRSDPVQDYLDALERIRGVGPTRVLPGHGQPITRVHERLSELRAATEAEIHAVADLLEVNPNTPWEITQRRYSDRELPPSAWVQAVRETLAHLHHLAATGRAEVEQGSGGVLYFRALGVGFSGTER